MRSGPERLRQAIQWQRRLEPLGDGATKESIEFAKQMKAYGVSQVDKAELMRDALSTFADAHHAEMVLPTLAKMKFANKAVFGQAQGADNERMFMDLLKVIELRGGLASEAEFRNQADMVQRVITATGGRVQADEWLNVIKRGGLAAKGMDSEAFYYTLEPLVQEMGGNTVGTAMMSAYQNLYQGKTTKRTLGNPLLAVIAIITAGAIYVWQNWETIGPKLAALWQAVKDAFGRAWDWIKEKAGGIADWFTSTKDKLLDAGRAMVDGLLSGISERWAALKQKVGELADGVATWFKEKLGIHSPSRVFATLGGFTMAGLAQGLEDGQKGPLQAVHSLATKLTGIGAGIAIGSTAAVAAPISFDTRPPLTTNAMTAAPAAAAAPITIHIHPPAGADPQAIARLVRDELRQIENQRAARQRSRLADRD